MTSYLTLYFCDENLISDTPLLWLVNTLFLD